MESGEDNETCWICLEGVEGVDISPGPLQSNRLIKPCRCPRVVHSVCLAKWQLSQSGKSEEKFCRFCKERLPDWQANLALPGMAAVEPVMSVHFNGQTHMVKVKSGEEGRMAFIQDVRRLLRLRDSQEFSITFECKVPGHGMFLDLKGLSSYDAAVFCAAMTAVERQRLAAQKAAQKLVATSGSRHATAAVAGTLLPVCSSATLATSLGAAENSSASSILSGGSSSRGSTNNGGDNTQRETSAPISAATPAPASTSVPTSSSSPSRQRTLHGSSAGAAQPDPDVRPNRPRAGSVSDVDGLHPAESAQRQAAGPQTVSGGMVVEAAASPSSASVPAGSARPVRPLGLVLSATDGGTLGGGAAAVAAMGRASSSGRSASCPPQQNQQQPAASVCPAPRGPTGWGTHTYDSACEVESAAAMERAGASGAPPDGGALTAAAGGIGDGDARHGKPFAWHGFRGIATQGDSGSSGVPPAVPVDLFERRRGEYGKGTWLSRLMLCASFGGDDGEPVGH
ncbi:hypothetical protein VOLCADRAFT_103291 [Volvox carteri f. nagariensis]|uniref:RING-CH-type domain-containing protein n=1 Tax=Volvox carteri f. nagariensis TaxID=3068 RepID=D8TL07_VOLCA|nr:uncharacterized protein VOLCADRAFT_103291 [Volvox carteri f. nagariensis]EFJ51791.1 hypothetical protein VOLCADRAFT_103291 [Volvox carteri f. nagariensis]|eukprot:XP_002947201.1 hypothetical protein VOLCADRAFT_103291 [Volvox carteri f. nagariensis]